MLSAQPEIENGLEWFETGRPVAFPWLCDAMGHVATQHQMAMFDSAAFHFLEMIGPPFAELAAAGRGWADVRHELDYRAEIRAGELLRIRSRLDRATRRTVRYTHELLGADGTLRTTLVAVTAHFDLDKRIAIEVPLLRLIPQLKGDDA